MRLIGAVARNPFRILVTLVLSGCAGMIAFNALVLQQARHPAPLFNYPGIAPQAAMPAPPPRANPAPVLAPAAPPAMTEPSPLASSAPPVPPSRGAITDLIRSHGETAPPPPRPAAAAAKPAAARDPIAEMIRMGGAVPTPPANVGAQDDPVLAAQRALVKLGYSVKPDGMMGGETRAALERFEQDRRLPVTGALNARTAQDLSAASGIVITP